MKLASIWMVAVAVACGALSGCAAVVLLNMGPEQRAALFVVPADKAVIYFYRDEANDDTLPLALSVNGNVAGETHPAKFLFYEVEPGHHVLVSWGSTASGSVALDAEAGKTYFVGQEIGCDAAQFRMRLHTDNPAAGKARVRALYAAGKADLQTNARTVEYPAACLSTAEDVGGTPH